MNNVVRKTLRAAGFAVVGSFAAGSASAATITIDTETGIAMETEFGIRADTGTRGYELAGAEVTVSFDDGSSETRTWIADPNALAANGGAFGTNWSFFQNAVGTVNLISDGRVMTGFSIDASTSVSVTPDFGTPPGPSFIQGASLFDVSPKDELLGENGSTVGSSFGSPFEFTFGDPVGDVAVTYSGAVNITGQAAVGDLFTTMTVDFTGLEGGGFTGSANYFSDQDTLAIAGDLVRVAAVPLPAGLPLLVAALGGLGLMRRKQR